MKRLLLPAALLLSAATAQAGELRHPERVVELFTSQGCSSCPPANRFVARLAEDDAGALALSYGVTYWDYLGWKDTFGDPAFTERQRGYRDALDARMYTPQIVVNGTDHAPRWKRRTLAAHSLGDGGILATKGAGGFGDGGPQLTVTGGIAPGAVLAVVRYRPGTQDVAVRRGENGGRTLSLANVVTGIDMLEWTGEPVSLRPGTGEAVALLVHDPETAAIVAALDYTP